jgi:hypothetical protein
MVFFFTASFIVFVLGGWILSATLKERSNSSPLLYFYDLLMLLQKHLQG